MRFKIERHVCVEVASLEELEQLDGQLSELVEDTVGARLIRDEHGSVGGGSIEALDDESQRALDEAWDAADAGP